MTVAAAPLRGIRSRRWVSARPPRSARRPVVAVPARRGLQVALGLLWLLDAALQFQPFMFSTSFITKIIEPATTGSPAIIAHSVTWAAQQTVRHVAIYNAAFATIQLAIAAGFFFRRSVKAALGASIVWALCIWWFGESLGGILTGATPLAGAPGAVVLYALIAILVWPTDRHRSGERVSSATSGPLGATIPKLGWTLLWGSFAYCMLLPANRAPSAISHLLSDVGDGQPRWVGSLEADLAAAAAHHGTEISVVAAVSCGLVALAVFVRPLLRPGLFVAVVLGGMFWVAEGFGGIFTGQSTDPNTGLLLVLLAACYWPFQGLRLSATAFRS